MSHPSPEIGEFRDAHVRIAQKAPKQTLPKDGMIRNREGAT